MGKVPDETYLEKAGKLTKKEAELVYSRMSGKLGRRLEDQKLSPLEALAIQLEKEDEQLREWRENYKKILDRDNKK